MPGHVRIDQMPRVAAAAAARIPMTTAANGPARRPANNVREQQRRAQHIAVGEKAFGSAQQAFS